MAIGALASPAITAPAVPNLPTAGPSQGADIAQAVGGIYDAYQQAQQAQVDQKLKLAESTKQRLGQIWELGVRNPQLQQDPRVAQQVQMLYKQMGMPAPVDASGKVDWAMLQPTTRFDQLKDPTATMKYLQSIPEGAQREQAARNMGIVGIDPSFFQLPRTLTPQEDAKVRTDYTKIYLQAGYKNMTPDQYVSWVKNSRNAIDQAYGPGTAESMMADKDVLRSMGDMVKAKIDKLNDALQDVAGPAAKGLGAD